MGEVYNMFTTSSGKFHYIDTETGEHFDSYTTDQWKGYSETTNPPKMIGWICPVCGRGLSPYTSMCPCKGYPKMEVTC